jgi:hypothetical protein
VDQHAGRRRDELDLLGRLPADLDEGRAVACADLLFFRQVVEDLHPVHPRRKRASASFRAGVGGNRDGRLFQPLRSSIEKLLGLVEQAELVTVTSLTAGAEALAAEQPDVLAELLDLAVAFLDRAVALPHERPQTFDIIRKLRALQHRDQPSIRFSRLL